MGCSSADTTHFKSVEDKPLCFMARMVFSKELGALLDLADHSENDPFGSRFQYPKRSVPSPFSYKHAVALSGSCFG